MLRKFVSACLLSLLLLGLIGNFLPQTKASSTFTVTEEDDYITIENDYYIANISRIIEGGAGAIKNFYIKPHDTVNIVCDQTFKALGGHEEGNYYNSTYAKSCTQWLSYSQQSVSVEIVYRTSSVVTIKSVIDFGGYNARTETWYLELGLVEYKTFYADKPYYLVTYSKIYQEDLRHPYNPQTCFLFDVDTFWDRAANPNCTYTLNETGGIVHGEVSSAAYLSHAKIYGKFPWFWVFNTTLGTGYGIILLDAYPTAGEVFVGLEAGGGGSPYSEFQFDHNWGGEADEAPDTVTYLGVVNDTTSYSYIDQLATDLYLSSVEPEPITDAYCAVKANNSTNSAYAGCGRTLGATGRPFPTYLTFPKASKCRWAIQFKNATSTYSLFSWDDLTNNVLTYDSSYTAFDCFQDWENKFRYNYTLQIWNNSDTAKLTVYAKTLQTVNITDLWLYHYNGGSEYHQHEIAEYPDFCKVNLTSSNIYQDEGWMIKNITNQARTHPNILWTYYWMEDNDADTEYSTDTEWTIQLYIQYFRIYKWQDKDEFLVSDFHEPSEKTVDLSWNVHYWLPMPLFNQEGDLRLLRSGDQNSTAVVYTEYASDKLMLVLVGENSQTQDFELYCGSKGDPISVKGATSWSYNSTSKICTITVTHSSHVDVEVDWSDGMHSVYILNVYVKRGNSVVANANVTIEGETKQTNLFGTCTFELPTGHYEVTASYGDVTKTKRVLLNQNKTIGINLPPRKGHIHM